MKRTWNLTFTALLLLFGFSASELGAGGQGETFSGRYDWNQGSSDELSAEFRPDGDDRWKVTFRFRFGGRSETWTGTAKGSLADGSELSGTATSGSRNWTFAAGVEDGVMRGTHREIKRSGSEYATGSFQLSR